MICGCEAVVTQITTVELCMNKDNRCAVGGGGNLVICVVEGMKKCKMVSYCRSGG
jgi:hypothetical protein